jgi:hypothetical protein
MTTRGFNRLAGLLATIVGVAAMGAGCNLEPGALGQPTYEADVRPIFMSRCVRCHGSPPLGDSTSTLLVDRGPPVSTVRFDVYADTGCDNPDAGAACVRGALHEAMIGSFHTYLELLGQDKGGMPPLPSPALTSYQKDTILHWAAEPTPLER